jgi:hypothetical protein
MHISMKSLRLSLTAAVAVCALFALTASSAFAAPATWSTPGLGTTKWETASFTLSYNGSALACTLYAPTWSGYTTGSSFTLSPGSKSTAKCGGSTVNTSIAVVGDASQSGGVFSLNIPGGWVNNSSPWGLYTQSTVVGTFTNGSGATPSTVTFNNVTIGVNQATGLPLTLSGTFTVKTGTGGLLTLS